jgi:hypothetical protein
MFVLATIFVPSARQATILYALAQQQNLDSKSHGLLPGALGKLGAGNAVRKAHVVLDQRRRSRLSADRVAFDHHGMQALRSRINRCRKPRRACAVDRDVVLAAAGLRNPSQMLGKLADRRRIEPDSVRKLHDRQPLNFGIA